MTPEATVVLNQFNWTTLISVFGIMVTIIGFLGVLLIKWFKNDQEKIGERMAAEAESRKKADQDLATSLRGITDCLHDFRVEVTKSHGQLVSREELKYSQGQLDMKMDSFHKRLDDLFELLSDGYVTKDVCNGKHKD